MSVAPIRRVRSGIVLRSVRLPAREQQGKRPLLIFSRNPEGAAILILVKIVGTGDRPGGSNQQALRILDA
ncbi:MAG TPA: hypothetical protein PK308_08300, partial [Phycisphaerales bacterium]|nr:hypothetical protein [Phycisphaerales bacterium]